jgi:hypothetical protein
MTINDGGESRPAPKPQTPHQRFYQSEFAIPTIIDCNECGKLLDFTRGGINGNIKHERLVVAGLIVLSFALFVITAYLKENLASLTMNATLALIGYFAGSSRN